MFYKKTGDSIEINIKLIPSAKREEILGIFEDENGNDVLKISIHSKPKDNEANESLIKFLSKKLGVAKSLISIKNGLKSRRKTILVLDNKINLDSLY